MEGNWGIREQEKKMGKGKEIKDLRGKKEAGKIKYGEQKWVSIPLTMQRNCVQHKSVNQGAILILSGPFLLL